MYLFKNIKFAFLWTLLTFMLALLLINNTLLYFYPNVQVMFLLEKGALADWTLWRGAFYFHIVSSCMVLLVGFPLFFPTLLKYRKLHRWLGYIYFNGVLWFAAPSGLILAPFAKGGLMGATGFLLTGIFWWFCTWRGYTAIRDRQVNKHIQWMVRSWCLSLSAVSFRILHVAFDLIQMDPIGNYVLSIWLSLLINALLAELFIARNFNLESSNNQNRSYMSPDFQP